MTGRIVYTPSSGPRGHRCDTPDNVHDHPLGTVWQCNPCGTCWVLRMEEYAAGFVPQRVWHREGLVDRLVRRWRERRQPPADVVPIRSTSGPPAPLQPGEPTVCLLDHNHTPDCPGWHLRHLRDDWDAGIITEADLRARPVQLPPCGQVHRHTWRCGPPYDAWLDSDTPTGTPEDPRT